MQKLIVIDPGHGGKDPGGVYEPYVRPGAVYTEKDIGMSVSCHLAGYLTGYYGEIAYKTTLTRTRDKYVSLTRRVMTANMTRADAFLSIHVNDVRPAIDPATRQGASVLYYRTSEKGFDLADRVLAEILQTSLLKGFSDGVIPSGLYVLRKTRMPAVLVELGFIRNYQDLQVITDEDNQAKLAYAIFKGLHYWFVGKEV